MSGELAAAGDIATGALIASTVEPDASSSQVGHAAPALCLDCETRLVGPHCHGCGQSAHVYRSVTAIGHELLHGVFHFEGKAFRTLPLLLFRPGELTRRYVAGERARFVSPLAVFLLNVFLLFATINIIGGNVVDLNLPPEASRTGAAFQVSKTGWERLDKGVAKANANPGLALYKVQGNAYKYSWLLIPLSTPFVALLFLWRRRFAMYDHAVFVTFSISFMMLLVIMRSLLGSVGIDDGVLALAATIVPPIHLYRQLRGAYSLRRRSALWRTMALVLFAVVILVTFTALMLVHGIAG